MIATMSIIIVILISTFAGVGMLLYKLYSNTLQKRKWNIKDIAKYLNWFFITGSICYVLSALLTIYVLKTEDLSTIFPLTALKYVIVLVLSSMFLKEKITSKKLIGTTLIIAGVVLVTI